MTTLLTFLGTGSYKTVTYVWSEMQGQKTCQTHLFPLAAWEFFRPQRVVLIATQEVVTGKGKSHYETFQQALRERHQSLELIQIPDGKSPQDLWTIFDRMTDCIHPQETVLLDVTHAFRSLPMLALAVAIYLRRTKGVSIERILYGAYEAREPFRDMPEPTDQAPVFDLTPILDLLDWLAGAEALLQRGDAQVLAQRMEQTHRQLWKQPQGDQRPYQLQGVARDLQRLTQALYLVRPLEVMATAHRLLPKLQNARQEFQQWAKPFAVLVEQVQREIEPLAYEEPNRLDDQQLRCQLALVDYYLKKGLIIQAITLAREWVVSWMFLLEGQGDWLDYSQRERIGRILGAAVKLWCKKEEASIPDWLQDSTYGPRIAQVWDWISQLRNDVAHGGMRQERGQGQDIIERAQQIPNRLQSLLDNAPLRESWVDRVVIDLGHFYTETAKLDELPDYIARARELAGQGNEVVLTGQAPIWMYLSVAHGLHGVARRLWYDSPVTGKVLIFDHHPG